MLSTLLFIQDAVDAAVQTAETVVVEKETLWEMALKGGWIMAVLGAGLVAAIYIFIERYLVLRNAVNEHDASDFMNKIRDYVHRGDFKGASDLAKQTNTPIARMIGKGVDRMGRPLPDIRAAIENVGQLEVAKLEKRVSLVATIASLGPMVGFLGTVTGMITAFRSMAEAGNNIDISLLASGIYEAMVTTVGGLIVGIVCFFLHNLLVTRIDKVVNELEIRSTEFMDLLHEPA